MPELEYNDDTPRKKAPAKPTQPLTPVLVPNPGDDGGHAPLPGSVPDPGTRPLPFMGPVAPLPTPDVRGRERWDRLLRTPPVFAGSVASQDWDQWILSLKGDPADAEYSAELRQAQFGARQRQEERGKLTTPEQGEPGAGAPPLTGTVGTAVGAAAKPTKAAPTKPKAKEYKPVIIGHDGKPVETPGLTTDQVIGQSGAAAPPPSSTAAEVGKLVTGGDYVYISSGTEVVQPSAKRTQVENQHRFMAVDDAYIMPAYWAPNEVAKFQKMMGLDETGVYDEKTFAKWKDVVDIGARYTQAGRNVDLMQVATLIAPKKKAGSGSGGGGGGGGYSASQVAGFINSVMEEEAGREATAAEQAAFVGALNGAGDVDPQQFAKDWIRGRLGGEAGAFSAVNFYDAMLQVLGSNTQAVEP